MKGKVFLFIGAILFCAQSVFSCELGSLQELGATWKSFRSASLNGTPEEIRKFYLFPFKMKSPDGEGTLKITKNIFLRNYKILFREAFPNQENVTFTDMKKLSDDVFTKSAPFGEDGCSKVGATHIDAYHFKWVKNSGWHIDSMYTLDYVELASLFKYGSIKR